jgi:exosortase
LQLIYLALAVFAYRGLLTFGSQADLSRELEEWFFIPTETSPLVVVLLAGWLIYRRRERLVQLRAEAPAWSVAAPLLLAGTAVFAWSALATAPHLLAISMIFEGLGLAALLFGRAGLRIALLPSMLLIFAVPMPAPLLAEIVYQCQIWTADYTGWLLFAMGESAYVSGDQILLSDDHFSVIEGCSGLRSVQTLTMVALLLVDLFGRKRWHAATIIALAPFVAFALNGFRVLALILNPHSEVVAIHNLQGVVILLGGLMILYGIDGWLERFSEPKAERPSPTADPPAPAAAGPRAWVAATALAVLAGLTLVIDPWTPPAAESEVSAADLPLEIGSWIGSDENQSGRSFLGSIGYRVRIDRRYEGTEAPVEMFLLIGDLSQRYRSPLSPKTVPPGSGWIVEQASSVEGRSTYVMRSGTRRMMVDHWYEGTDGMLDEIVRGLVSLDASPWHRPADVLAIRISTEVVGATRGAFEKARSRLDSFESALKPDLRRLRDKLGRKRIS